MPTFKGAFDSWLLKNSHWGWEIAGTVYASINSVYVNSLPG